MIMCINIYCMQQTAAFIVVKQQFHEANVRQLSGKLADAVPLLTRGQRECG